MNQTLNLKRLLNFAKMEVQTNKNIIIRALLSLLTVMLIICLFNELIKFSVTTAEMDSVQTTENICNNCDDCNCSDDNNCSDCNCNDANNNGISFNQIGEDYLLFFRVLIILIPFFLYQNLYNKVKSVNHFMLSASQLEKVLSAIILTSIIFPALLSAAFWLIALAIHLIMSANIVIGSNDFFKVLFDAIQIQSVIFLGVFWFKGNKFLKMILTMIVFLISLYLIVSYIYNPFLSGFISNTAFSDFLVNRKTIIIGILFPLVPWLISYKRFTKTQI